jgi:hypothetical protein
MKEKIQISYTSFKSCRSEVCLDVEVVGIRGFHYDTKYDHGLSLQGLSFLVPYVITEEVLDQRKRENDQELQGSGPCGKDSGFLVYCVTREEM